MTISSEKPEKLGGKPSTMPCHNRSHMKSPWIEPKPLQVEASG